MNVCSVQGVPVSVTSTLCTNCNQLGHRTSSGIIRLLRSVMALLGYKICYNVGASLGKVEFDLVDCVRFECAQKLCHLEDIAYWAVVGC